MTQIAVRQFWKTPGNDSCVDTVENTALQWLLNGDPWLLNGIAVFPSLADGVDFKTGSRSTAQWRIHFIRLNGWLRHSCSQLITLDTWARGAP